MWQQIKPILIFWGLIALFFVTLYVWANMIQGSL